MKEVYPSFKLSQLQQRVDVLELENDLCRAYQIRVQK